MRHQLTSLYLLAILLCGALAANAQQKILGKPTPAPAPQDLYFTDCRDEPGAIYRYDQDAGKSLLHRRLSGRVRSFSFAPWDPDLLFLASGNEILEVDLSTGKETEVYSHRRAIRDLAFDTTGALFFSDQTRMEDRVPTPGTIFRMDSATGDASSFFTVQGDQVGGYWPGNFGFDPDGKLLLSSGYRNEPALYEVDLGTGVSTRLYHSSAAPLSERLTGFAHDPAGTLLITGGDERSAQGTAYSTISTLDLTPPAATGQVYEDPDLERICDVGFRASEPPPPSVSVPGLWVMPYGLGGFRVDQIKPTGLVDYAGVVDAPFGGHLGFLLDSHNAVPVDAVHYYRLSYSLAGGTWIDFDAPVFIHYVKNRPGKTPVFPLFKLGPVNVDGQNLYRFRPHQSTLQQLVAAELQPGETVEWPKIGLAGDRIRGHLNSVGLADGKYRVRYQIFTVDGQPSSPGRAFQMVVPDGVDAAGTLLTKAATIKESGVEFTIHVDNRPTEGVIAPPRIGGTETDDCGFLRYATGSGEPVRIAWRAWHPGGFATYGFTVTKADTEILSYADEVASSAHAGSNGDFEELIATSSLLGGCTEAAFAASLRVYAKAVDGAGNRLSRYDSGDLRAFAIAPQ